MKNRQKKKKHSTFMKSLRRKSKGQSENRSSIRGNNDKPPHSQKIAQSSMNNHRVFRTKKYEGNNNRKGFINDIAA